MTNIYAVPQPKFPLGELHVTAAVEGKIDPADIASALSHHANGDWGDVCDEDWNDNDESLAEGFRLFSVYHDRNHVKFWIITERDRSATTVLFPDDY